jgi:NtrC-family two-component system response regulator AlgB
MDIRKPIGVSATDLTAGNGAGREALDAAPLLESQNPAITALLEMVQRAANSDTTILLTGESGTGKDVLARQIHRWSPRRGGPFVVINCTTFAEHLLENELFGHVRGAFTGAINDRTGRLEAGDGGTVLFDEIAELPTSLQARFLRFTQEHEFERIGGGHTINVNVRLLAASNRNLQAEVAAGRFREDLYYRLSVITFTLPPLRERTQDILPLAQWLLRHIPIKAGTSQLSLSQAAAEALLRYGWPGNVRELHNALERAAALARSRIIALADLPDSVRQPVSIGFVPTAHGASLKDFEREHILRVLAESPTLERAAATLGINVTTLWRKRRHYRIA